MRNVALTVSTAAGLLMAVLPNAVFAGDRPVIKQQYAQASSAPQSYRNDGGGYDRKCMTLPCGTRWCYNVRR